MNPKHLFPDEVIIAESDNKQIILTSHRLKYQSSSSGHADTTSFLLEKISAIQTNYQSAVMLLIIGIVACVAGLAIGADPKTQEMLPVGIIIGAVLIVLYFYTRKHTAIITAECGTKIKFEINSSKKEALYDFINKIEKAKNERYLKMIQ